MKTDKEIAAEIKRLKEVRLHEALNKSELCVIDAQIEVLDAKMDAARVSEVHLTRFEGVRVLNAAFDASDWVHGDAPPPSEV